MSIMSWAFSVTLSQKVKVNIYIYMLNNDAGEQLAIHNPYVMICVVLKETPIL